MTAAAIPSGSRQVLRRPDLDLTETDVDQSASGSWIQQPDEGAERLFEPNPRASRTSDPQM